MKPCPDQCRQCPFRSTSAPGWLGGYERPENVFSSLWAGYPFFCHMRTNYKGPRWELRALKNGNLCLGALIFVGRQYYFPKSANSEIREAVEWAMAQYREHPENFEVLEPQAFLDHHNSLLRKCEEIRLVDQDSHGG